MLPHVISDANCRLKMITRKHVVCSFQVPLTAEAVKRPVAFIAYKKVSLT